MKIISFYTFCASLTFIIPTISNPLFDIVLIITTLIGVFTYFTKPSCFAKIQISKSLIALFFLFVLIIFSFLKNNLIIYLSNELFNYNIQSKLKLSILGLLTITLIFTNFILITSLIISEKEKINFLFINVCAGGLLAAITSIYWFIITGAQFERYNYFPLISESQGIHQYYMIITLLFSLILIINRVELSKVKFRIVIICFFFAFFSMLTVMVREGWIIFIMTLFLSWYKLTNASKLNKIIIASFSIFFVAGIVIYSLTKLNLVEDIYSASNAGGGESTVIRFLMIENSLPLIFSNPFLGVGYGNFSIFVSLSVELSGGNLLEVNSPHNAIILLTSELGILGIFLIVLLSLSILLDLNTSFLRSQSKFQRTLIGFIYTFLLLVLLDQIISNSTLLPPPAERPAVQLSFLIWTTISVIFAKNSKSSLRL